jgi:hypothetical protein
MRQDATVLFVVELHPIKCWCTWPQICQSARFSPVFRVPTSYEDRGLRMGKADVEDWVLASTVAPEDSGDTENDGWNKTRILSDWTEGIQIIRTSLSSSSTKTRAELLEGLIIPLVKDESESSFPGACGGHKTEALEGLTASQTLEIFGIFTQVYPRYTDARSREDVEEVITQIMLRDQSQGGAMTEKMLGWLASEAGRISKQVLPGYAYIIPRRARGIHLSQ